MRTKPLLICGILGSVLYLFADVVGGLIWQGYSHASQGVSELMAVGPNAPGHLERAHRIVRAVNAHDSLVAALEATRAELLKVEELIYTQEGMPAPTVLRMIIERASTALTRAKEK